MPLTALGGWEGVPGRSKSEDLPLVFIKIQGFGTKAKDRIEKFLLHTLRFRILIHESNCDGKAKTYPICYAFYGIADLAGRIQGNWTDAV